MLWDPASTKKNEEGEGDSSSVPILVPLQSKSAATGKTVPVLVPDVQDLKDQFQHQQDMLMQIKETLKQNESQLNSKEKQVEVYANKLSQIRARTKNTQGKKTGATVKDDAHSESVKPLVKKSSKENLGKLQITPECDKQAGNNSKIGRVGKISELKKCLEENKLKFEQITGKEQTETKMIESLVEQMKSKLDERDKTIQDLQKHIEENVKLSKLEDLPKKSRKKGISKFTQTTQTQVKSDDSNELITLQNKIYELETTILDLQENLKEKESVIDARTQAVTLLSQDLSLKGKNTLENLEETRQEMRTMQHNFIDIENRLKNDITERDNRLSDFEEKYNELKSINSDMGVKNAELQEKLVKLQERYADMEMELTCKSEKRSSPQSQAQLTNEKLEELEKKLTVLTKELDDRNKAMIKMKIEHKNKLKNVNQIVQTLKGASDEKAEIVKLSKMVEEYEAVKVRLENRVAELEDDKGNLLLSILDVDDLKATEKKLKDQINELEITINRQNEEMANQLRRITVLEKEKSDLVQVNQDQNVIIENLYEKMLSVDNSNGNEETSAKELNQKLKDMEEEYNRRIENLKLEHGKELEMLESYYNSKIENAERRELEDYRISTEISNIHVEEQIELLIREKQQLLEKLKSLSGVSSVESMAFEKVERSELRDYKESGEDVDGVLQQEEDGRLIHLQKIINDQQGMISELQTTIQAEKQKTKTYESRLGEMEETIRDLEGSNALIKEQIKTVDAGKTGKNQKSNLNAKNKVKKIEMELGEAKKLVEEQSKKLDELKEKLEGKDELIKKYIEKIELFEKDDWDRQNHWQNTQGDFENVDELQTRCLSLEHSLMEINEHFERLRKENIEIVHQLSEEKVKRRKLLEELGAKSGNVQTEDLDTSKFREKVDSLNQLVSNLDTKIEKLETTLSSQSSVERIGEITHGEEESWESEELQQKLEWTNVVLTSKETEIFRLQSLLEDRSKTMEDLLADVNEYKVKLSENEKTITDLMETVKARENQILEMSTKFSQIEQEYAESKARENETQLQQLMGVLKQMETEMLKKDSQLEEVQGILAQKNNDIVHLRNQMEITNNDIVRNYQEELDKLHKSLESKESQCNALLAEKNNIESAMKNLSAEKEHTRSAVTEIAAENAKLQQSLLDKEKLITELSEKLTKIETSGVGKASTQDTDDMKIKMKKLAANLKKKAQNETELLQRVTSLEAVIADKDAIIENLQAGVQEITEKWTTEKCEKEHCSNELAATKTHIGTLQNELTSLVGLKEAMEKELQTSRAAYEDQIRQLKAEIQQTLKACDDFKLIEQQYKDKVSHVEKRLTELSSEHQSALLKSKETEDALDEARKSNETGLHKLAEMTGKFEEMKFKHDQIVLLKEDLENKLEEFQKQHRGSADKSVFDAKLQENLAVIENLESELTKAQDRIKYVEEKLFASEERRLSLENRNEEMCLKMTEESENRMTIDGLANQVDELLKSEKHLMGSVKSLEANNADLKQAFEEAQSGKQSLDSEVKVMSERIHELTEELKQLRNAENEKNNSINCLTKELEKTKAENTKILEEYKKLNRDYEQFEIDFKENLENSQNAEKSLRQKIEELTSENSILVQKVNFLVDDKTLGSEKSDQSSEEDKKPRKKKSVTFRTDEVEYIKDLKQQLHSYDARLKEANDEIEKLKGELLREALKHEVSDVVTEAQEKAESLKSVSQDTLFPVVEPAAERTEVKGLSAQEQGERKFDASVFFGAPSSDAVLDDNSFFDVACSEEVRRQQQQREEVPQNPDFDSLVWDDGWGTDGHLEEEYLSKRVVDSSGQPNVQYDEKIKSLEAEIEVMKSEVEKLTKELQAQTAKYTKALKKLKEQKVTCDKLQAEVNKVKSNDGFGDLNATIVDELKLQIENMEKKEREYLKNLESHKAEKESLLKKIDVLNAGNEKFLEMKERQDNDTEIWQGKNKELLKEISELRQQLEEPRIVDDSVLAQENKELLCRVEALEWKNCELTQLLEEKEEMMEERQSAPMLSANTENVTEEKSLLQKEIEELKNVKVLLEKKLTDEESKNATNVQELSALAAENETLQDILGKMKDKEISKGDSKVEVLNQKIAELEGQLTVRDSEIFSLRESAYMLEVELNDHKQKLGQLQSEKDLDRNRYTESLTEMEGKLRESEAEVQLLKDRYRSKEEELMRERLENQSQPISLEISKFDAIDLNQSVLQPVAPADDNTESLKEKISQLEQQLKLKEEAMQVQSFFAEKSGKEMDNLKQRNTQLEDSQLAKMKEDELNEFKSTTWNQNYVDEVNQLKRSLNEMQEYLSFKEQEIYQLKLSQSNELQTLNMKLFEMENVMKARDIHQNEEVQQKIFDLENMVRLAEEESRKMEMEKGSEIENQLQRIMELEGLLSCKDEEIGQLVAKLTDLEKSYNDSKIEIERLLNEEKLNSEEKFVEPFQNNFQIPVAFELEAMTRSLEEEKQKSQNLQFELSDREKLIQQKVDEIQSLEKRIIDLESHMNSLMEVENRQKVMAEESHQTTAQLEKIVTDLQRELESSNLQLSETRRELEQYQNSEDEMRSKLKSRLTEMETMLMESTEKKDSEILELKSLVEEKTNFYESLLRSKKEEDTKEKAKEVEAFRKELEKEMERLRLELVGKENDIATLSQTVSEGRSKLDQLGQILEERDREVADLKQMLGHMQVEISSFRNFEKQVKELRMAQVKASDSTVTPEGEQDLSGWTEHELAELSNKLQSDLDTALYMLHQRDVRCDELTFELMQLIEERDTLQLRLSTALRMNEELKAENKDLVDQSNDRQGEKLSVSGEDLQQLADKISQLHSISYLRDKTVKDDSVQRHAEQMSLLARISDSEIPLGKEAQSSSVSNWARGKPVPKVMHI
ncbi:hypothetical protein RUM43_012286 [Polyplax serrata]|uniref:Golgin subfamily B member 1-like n=1 Tax=Polyplax serrata TaxID=468196 RepID=A0AAN8S356_POLSC